MCLNELILKMWDLASSKSAEEATMLGIFRDNVANTVERQQHGFFLRDLSCVSNEI